MKPLAYRLRPNSFNDVIGQDHLVGPHGIITTMIKKNQLISFILHGNPGTGKTTIATLVSELTAVDTHHFNASVDNKSRLKEIIDVTAYHDILLIIDEIHRMKTDIQDYLLPFIENGKVTIIGLTTLNPYMSVNPAIRSRCHVYKVNDITADDILIVLERALKSAEVDTDSIVSIETLNLIAESSNSEVRTALNMLEAVLLVGDEQPIITPAIARLALGKHQLKLDQSGDNYYEILSAFQKSIRGSDVDASLHYLARLIVLEDLQSIIRRLLVIVYEDVGLANPNLGPKVLSACETALKLGLPEARMPLSVAVIETALSPKSNTAHLALDAAIEHYNSGKTGDIPKHIINSEISKNKDLYKYPHDYPNAVVRQQYLPDKIKDKQYFLPKEDSTYEKALKNRMDLLKKL